MKKHLVSDQRGATHLVLIVLAVVILAVGAVGYMVMKKEKTGSNKPESSAKTAADAVKEAAKNCNLDDKDICKFYSSWKEHKYYNVSGTGVTDGESGTFTLDVEGEDKTHVKLSGGGLTYEIITIGNTTYTKDESDGKWWKQVNKTPSTDDPTIQEDFDFSEPTNDENATDKTIYTKIGKEACGNLTCFKYQVKEPDNKDMTEYIWFDDKDYQLRRVTTQEGSDTSDMTVSYNKVSISEPSPVKEM